MQIHSKNFFTVFFTRWEVHVRVNILKLIKGAKVCYLLYETFIQGYQTMSLFHELVLAELLIKLKIFLQVKK